MLAIKNATIVMKDHLIPEAVLFIEGEKIAGYGEMRTTKIPEGCEIIDAKGKWVLPGFVDVGSSCAAAVLCNGLIPDYSRMRWQGSMIHGRILPMLEIAAEVLTDEEKRDMYYGRDNLI